MPTIKDIAEMPEKRIEIEALNEGFNQAIDEIGAIEINEVSVDNVAIVVLEKMQEYNDETFSEAIKYSDYIDIARALLGKFHIIIRK